MIYNNGKCYVIDIDRIMEWVSENPSSEKNITTVTTVSYPMANDDSDEMVAKEISENKSSMNDSMNNIRYDIIRNLLSTLFTTYTDGMGRVVNIDAEDLSFPQLVAFNTLMNKRIILEINSTDDEQ